MLNRAVKYPDGWLPGVPGVRPLGIAKNATTIEAEDGAPFDKDYINDTDAVFQGAVLRRNITISDVPDTGAVSDVLDGFGLMFGITHATIDDVINDATLKAGMQIRTQDYRSSVRGGGTNYLMKTDTDAISDGDYVTTPDDFGNHASVGVPGLVVILQSIIVDITQYGAIQDSGTTDNGDAMVAAAARINALGGGTYLVPSNGSAAYHSSKAVVFSTGNVDLQIHADCVKTNTVLGSVTPGAGPALINGSMFTFFSGTAGTTTPLENYLQNISVTGHGMPTIDGGGSLIAGFVYLADGLEANSIQFLYCATVRMVGVRVHNGLLNCLTAKFCHDVVIDNCPATDSVNENGISINQDTTYYDEDDETTKANAIVADTIATGCSDFGITSFNASGVSFNDCLSHLNSQGFSIEDGGSLGNKKINTNNIMTNCKALRNVRGGILVTSNGVTLDNCDAKYTSQNVASDPDGALQDFGNGLRFFDVDEITIDGGDYSKNTNKGIYGFGNDGANMRVHGSGAKVYDNGFQNVRIMQDIELCELNEFKVRNLEADSGYFDRHLYSRRLNATLGLEGLFNIADSCIDGPWEIDGQREVNIDGNTFKIGKGILQNAKEVYLFNNTLNFDPSDSSSNANQGISVLSTVERLYQGNNNIVGNFKGIDSSAIRNFGTDKNSYFNIAGTQQFLNKQSENNDATPTTGTFEIGSILWNTNPVSAQPMGWVCTVAGTVDTIGAALTGTGSSGSRILTIGGGGVRGELFEGEYLKMAGEPLRKIIRVMDNDGTGDQVFLDANLSSSPSAVAITRVAATFIPLANIP